MSDVKVGKHSFRIKTLSSITKEKAIESFSTINRAIVERAWEIANPKKMKIKKGAL
jgi:hypothetical protein